MTPEIGDWLRWIDPSEKPSDSGNFLVSEIDFVLLAMEPLNFDGQFALTLLNPGTVFKVTVFVTLEEIDTCYKLLTRAG